MNAIVGPAGNAFHQADAVIGEGRHGRMRPPISVVFTRLGGGQRHRLTYINDEKT